MRLSSGVRLSIVAVPPCVNYTITRIQMEQLEQFKKVLKNVSNSDITINGRIAKVLSMGGVSGTKTVLKNDTDGYKA